MDAEASQLAGAGLHERSENRLTYPNGYREREWDTRVGTVDLQIPKLRQGAYFPSLLEPRRRHERALLAVVQEAYVDGVFDQGGRQPGWSRAYGANGIAPVEPRRSAVDQFMHSRKRWADSDGPADDVDTMCRFASSERQSDLGTDKPPTRSTHLKRLRRAGAWSNSLRPNWSQCRRLAVRDDPRKAARLAAREHRHPQSGRDAPCHQTVPGIEEVRTPGRPTVCEPYSDEEIGRGDRI